jgi:hypothetical protein
MRAKVVAEKLLRETTTFSWKKLFQSPKRDRTESEKNNSYFTFQLNKVQLPGIDVLQPGECLAGKGCIGGCEI